MKLANDIPNQLKMDIKLGGVYDHVIQNIKLILMFKNLSFMHKQECSVQCSGHMMSTVIFHLCQNMPSLVMSL